MLKDRIFLTIRQVAGENFAKRWYWQNDAPPQYNIRRVRAYLDMIFPNQWIRKGGERLRSQI